MQRNSCFRRICNRRQYFLPVWNSQGGNLPDIRRRGSSPKSTKEKDTVCASRVRQGPTRVLPGSSQGPARVPKVLRENILVVHPGSARVLPGSCQGPARVPKVRRKNMIYCIQGPRTPFGFYNINSDEGWGRMRRGSSLSIVCQLSL